MKVTINSYNAIGIWRWNLKAGGPGARFPQDDATMRDANGDQLEAKGEGKEGDAEEEEEDDDDDDDDVCGICRVAYDGACPDCKAPGDGCPLIWGECTHVFHMHCLLKWISTDSSKQQCPMDRRPWITASASQPAQAAAAGVPPVHQRIAAAQ